MARNTSTITVRVLGNTKSLTRALKKSNREIRQFSAATGTITTALKGATAASAVFSTVAVGAFAAVGAAAIGAQAAAVGLTAAVVGVGIAAQAKMNPAVQKAFSTLKDNVAATMKEISGPLAAPLVRGAGQLQKAFDILAVSLAKIYQQAAPLLGGLFAQMPAVARELGPALESAFKTAAPLIRSFTESLPGAIGKLKEFFDWARTGGPMLRDKLWAQLKPIRDGFNELFRIIGDGMPAFSQAATAGIEAFGKLLPTLGKLAVAFAPLITILQTTLIPGFVTLADLLAKTVGPILQKVADFMTEHATAAKILGTALVGLVGTAAAISTFSKVMTSLAGVFTLVTKAFNLLKLALLTNPYTAIIAATVALVVLIVKNWDKIKAVIGKVWDWLKAATRKVWDAVKKAVSATVEFLGKIISKTWGAIKNATSAAWNAIKNVTAKVWNAVKNAVSKAINFIWNLIKRFSGPALLIRGWQAAKKGTVRLWNGIKDAVSNAIGRVMDAVRGIKDKIVGFFKNAGSWLIEAGKDIVRGLWDGIASMGSWIRDKAGSLADSIVGGFKSALSIFSPSRVFADLGKYVVQGLGVGLKQNAGIAARASSDLAAAVVRGFDAPKLSVRPSIAQSSAGHAGSRTYQITVQAPVGASSADIGRELTRHIGAFERSGGRKRA